MRLAISAGATGEDVHPDEAAAQVRSPNPRPPGTSLVAAVFAGDVVTRFAGTLAVAGLENLTKATIKSPRATSAPESHFTRSAFAASMVAWFSCRRAFHAGIGPGKVGLWLPSWCGANMLFGRGGDVVWQDMVGFDRKPHERDTSVK